MLEPEAADTSETPAQEGLEGLPADFVFDTCSPFDPLLDRSVERDAAKDWFVLHTRSRQEKKVAENLRGRGVRHFLPLVSHTRFYGKLKRHSEIPLFPCYVFMRGRADDAYDADRSKRLANIIRVGKPQQEHLTQSLRNIWRALREDLDLNPFPHLRQGVRVKVKAGPMQGVRGVIADDLSAGVLIINVDILNQAVSLAIEPSLLEVVDDEPGLW